MKKSRQGLLFMTVVGPKYLQLRLLGLLPLAWVRLDRIDHIRRSTHGEFWEAHLRRVLCFWKYWFWPYPLGMLFSPVDSLFVIETRRGLRIWLRLRSGMHYRLRQLVHQAKHGEP